jgi:hypothetical protein
LPPLIARRIVERLSPVAWLASARESAKGVRLDAAVASILLHFR